MYAKLLFCSLVLHLLGSCNGISNKGGEDIRIEEVLHSHTSSHMHHMDPASIVFFLMEDLTLGNTMPIYFPKRKLTDSLAQLLPKEEADSIPFSSHQLDRLLHRFSFSNDSPQAKAMRDTLEECERKPIKGETKYCATSWESMLDFLQTIFGQNIKLKALSTAHDDLNRSDDHALLQKYTIIGIEENPARRMVACHTMPYAYTVFYCHYQESENRLYRVSLRGENGDGVEAIAVCHMDTSRWGPYHVSFEVLGIEPGSSPVCHYFPADNFVWVPSTKP